MVAPLEDRGKQNRHPSSDVCFLGGTPSVVLARVRIILIPKGLRDILGRRGVQRVRKRQKIQKLDGRGRSVDAVRKARE
jgi:hypothetical protein